tara:strand:+ start:394 stop:1062 length:669 start_codon:yes stop_codon:yes gene_type:complete
MKKGYITNKYDEKYYPYTDYSKLLCEYLASKYNITENKTLLEPGCGRCDHLHHFKNLKLNVLGMDVSNEVFNYSKDIDIKICNLEEENMPYDDNSIDIIYSKSFIEHLSKPDNFLKESYRVLKPGGLLLTLVPDWESNYKTYFDDYTHKTPFTIVSLGDAYKIHGFININAIKFRQLPIVWKYPVLNYICQIISPFVPVRTKNKFLRWSRELMLIGSGYKPE